MKESGTKHILDAEIKNFNLLEQKVVRLIESAATLKRERDQAIKQKTELETLLRRREAEIADLKSRLSEQASKSLDPDKAELIKNKLSGLLDRLKEFE
jgi:hypothetical protein